MASRKNQDVTADWVRFWRMTYSDIGVGETRLGKGFRQPKVAKFDGA